MKESQPKEEVKTEEADRRVKKRKDEEEARARVLDQITQRYKLNNTEIMNSFLNGFNHATQSGPLCEEPMQGACFVVQSIELVEEAEDAVDVFGPFGG